MNHGSRPHSLSGLPGEFGFIVAAEVTELWWKLIVRELQDAQEQLRSDKLCEATRALKRVVAHFEPLNATWRSIAWMTPKGLLAISSRVSAGHVEAHPLQGESYRQLLFLLGIEQATAALAEPTLYDDVLAYFSRAGMSVPDDLLERDPRTPYVPSEDVEQIWREIHEDPFPDTSLQQLGDMLVEIAEALANWNCRQRMATLHAPPGSAIDELPFPELWSARGCTGALSAARPPSS